MRKEKMETQRRETEVIGNKIVVKTTGIQLEFNGQKIGERTLIDTYNQEQKQSIIADLVKQAEGAEKQIELCDKRLAELRKKLNKREEAKVREYLEMQEKAKAYMEIQKIKYERGSAELVFNTCKEDIQLLSKK